MDRTCSVSDGAYLAESVKAAPLGGLFTPLPAGPCTGEAVDDLKRPVVIAESLDIAPWQAEERMKLGNKDQKGEADCIVWVHPFDGVRD